MNAVDIVVVALVRAFTGIFLDELDPPALDLVHRADMHAVRADDLHMLGNAAEIGHGSPPWVRRENAEGHQNDPGRPSAGTTLSVRHGRA
jgi:hypothetical protein